MLSSSGSGRGLCGGWVSESVLEGFRFDKILLINLIQWFDREFGYCGVYCSRPLPPSDAACLEAN